GSLWVEGDNYLHYVGASGADYRCWWQIMHSDAATTRASVWIEGNYLYYSTPGGGKYWTHGDYTHSDAGPHTDIPHSDSHLDGSHGDFHGDGHTDAAHLDAPHTDGHGDTHTDYHRDHLDVQSHWDCNLYNGYEDPGAPPQSHQDHNDGAYQGNLHCDISHQDKHTDSPHGDAGHGDAGHADSHNDQAHTDSSHGDTHYDDPHQDAAGGGGGQHLDEPRYVGP